MDALRKLIIGENNFQTQTPWGGWAAFFMSISFYIFQIITMAVIGIGLVTALHSFDVFIGEYSNSDIPSFINIGIITVLASFILTFGFVLFAGVLRGGSLGNTLLLKSPVNPIANVIFGVVLMTLFFISFSYVIETFFATDAVESEAMMKLIFRKFNESDFLWAGIAIIVIGAPFLEETIFRGFLLASLSKTRLGFWGAAVVSSAMWTTMHWYAISMAVGLFVFGLLLSLMVRRTGSIWVSILMHGIWNGVITAAGFAAIKAI